MTKKIRIVCLICLAVSLVSAERFYPDEADNYKMTILGKNRTFYPHKNADFIYVPTQELADIDLNFFKRNPHICLSAKISIVVEEGFELYGTKKRVYYDADNLEIVDKYRKGDNVWIFAAITPNRAMDDFDVNILYMYELESDEEQFYRWKRDIKADDADAILELGMKALKTGKEKGNIDVWTKLGRTAIMEALQLKKTKVTSAKEYISLSEKVMNLLQDRELAVSIVVEAWKKNKEDAELKHYLKNVLRYSLYNDSWLPVAERYEKEFQDRFNAVAYTDDNAMWELKGWVELNSNKIPDPEEKIMLCAQRTYEMNPARADAAAFVGKPVSDLKGLTSGEGVTIPRKPISIAAGADSSLEFNLDNIWVAEEASTESIAAMYRATGAIDTMIIVKTIAWGENMEEVKDKYIDTVSKEKHYKEIGTEIISINSKDYYRTVYQYEEDGKLIRHEAILAKVPGDAPSLALIFQSPDGSYNSFINEFGKIRGSLKFVE